MVSALPDSVFGEPDAGNTAWMLASASMVLLMTPALAFFYGGLSRGQAVLNMMMMSFGSVATVSIVYVLWGFSQSFGNTVTGESDIWGIFANPFSLFGSDQWMNTAGTEDKPTYVLCSIGQLAALLVERRQVRQDVAVAELAKLRGGA